MIFPRKKLILPCHKNGYLQSASDAHKWRDRFKRNPLAKVADMFIPKPLRMSPGYPCCCGGGEYITSCPDFSETTWLFDFSGLSVTGNCNCIDSFPAGSYLATFCPNMMQEDATIYYANILNYDYATPENGCYALYPVYPENCEAGICCPSAICTVDCTTNVVSILASVELPYYSCDPIETGDGVSVICLGGFSYSPPFSSIQLSVNSYWGVNPCGSTDCEESVDVSGYITMTLA